MFPRCYIAFCPTCNEVTPHEDHTFGRRLSIAFGVAGIVLLLLPTALSWHPWLSAICILIPIVALIRSGRWFSFDRHELNVDRQCTRCRHKAHRARHDARREARRKMRSDLRRTIFDRF